MVSSDGFCSAFTPAAAGAGGLTYTPGLNVPPIICCTVLTVTPLEACAASQVTNALKMVGVVERSDGQAVVPTGVHMWWNVRITQPPLWFWALVTSCSICASVQVESTSSGARR